MSQTSARHFFAEQLAQRITPEWAESTGGVVFQFHVSGDTGGSWIVDLNRTGNWVC